MTDHALLSDLQPVSFGEFAASLTALKHHLIFLVVTEPDVDFDAPDRRGNVVHNPVDKNIKVQGGSDEMSSSLQLHQRLGKLGGGTYACRNECGIRTGADNGAHEEFPFTR